MKPQASNGRRRFLAGAAAATVGVCTQVAASPAPPGANHRAALPRAIGRALVTPAGAKNGSDATEPPPFAVRVLHRAGFGPRRRHLDKRQAPADQVFGAGFEPDGRPGEDDIGYFQSLGRSDDERLAVWVEEQLDPALPDPELDARMAQHAAAYTTLGQSLATVWQQRECQGFGEYARPYREVERAAFVRATYSRRQLFELMADFWHNHFNLYAPLSEDTYVSFADWDRNVIRKHAFGNFYQMLYASARHPAMLRYLDNYRNGDGGINENYARELFELHTLGAENYRGLEYPALIEALPENPYAILGDAELDNLDYGGGVPISQRPIQRWYVDADVYEAADALSGWRYNDTWNACTDGSFSVNPAQHIASSKSLLAQGFTTHRADLDPLLDGRLAIKMAAYHPGTATHIARKLCQRLIADDPPQEVVDAAAATFYAHRRSGQQIANTLRTILNSSAFKDAALWGSKTKRPFEYVVSAMRAAGGDYTFRMDDSTSDSFFWTYERTAQRLFRWRTPDGYPDRREHWQGSSTLVQSWRCIDWLTDRNADDGASPVLRIVDITLENLVGEPTPRQLVAFWCDWILGWTPAGGWVGPFGTDHSQAPTALGRAALQFMTQQGFTGDVRDVDVAAPNDEPIPRVQLADDSWPHYWNTRLRGLVALILWSPQFMQR